MEESAEEEGDQFKVVLHNKEKARRRLEYARLFFLSSQHAYALVQIAYSASLPPPIPSSVYKTTRTVASPTIPIHQTLTLTQNATAVQSYLVAIQTNEVNLKDNMAGAIRYELAIQLQRMGDSDSAAIHLEDVAQTLKFQSVNLPSRIGGEVGQTIQKKVKRKPSSRAPLTALCALQRALAIKINSGEKRL